MSRAQYHSQRRREGAEATRQAILDAARALFVERGYPRTTVADIAAAARVAVPTVYASVGTKSEILDELRKMIPVAAGVPGDTRAAFAPVDDHRRVVAHFVSGVGRLVETSGDLMYAIESAAPFEPVAANAWAEGMVIHRAASVSAVERIEALNGLSSTVSPTHAADILSFLSLPATWRTLGGEYGWTHDEVESWIVHTVLSLISDGAPPPRSAESTN